MIRIVRSIALTVALALIASVVMTVGTAAQDATPETSQQPTFPVTIKFLNAMTAQKEIDVYINGSDSDERVVEGLEYGTFSDDFEGTSPATTIIIKRNVQFGFDQWLFNTVIPSEAGKSYLVVVSDYVIIPTLVDTSVLSDAGSRVRFIHASAQAPSIDIVLNDEVVASGMNYGSASDVGVLPAGTYDFAVNATDSSTNILNVPGVEAAAGEAYTVVIIGEPGSEEEPLTAVADVEDLQTGS